MQIYLIFGVLLCIFLIVCVATSIKNIDKSSDNDTKNNEEMNKRIRDLFGFGKKPVKEVKYKSEEFCRSVAEDIFHEPFPKAHPEFLKNPNSGRNLEIDCFCEKLGIGIEFNGIQHYKYPNPFHRSREEFLKGLARDKFKIETCKANGILLIIIPYTMPKSRIRQYILDRVKEGL